MATTSLIAATTGAATQTFDCYGPATIVISANKLAKDEAVAVKAEDADGNYNDVLYIFSPRGECSCLIDTYRSVQVSKTATGVAVAVAYDGA